MNNRVKRYFDIMTVIAADVLPVARARHVAILANGNKIISIGYNQYKSHPLQKKFGRNSDSVYLHAEISAVANALRRYDEDELSKFSLYILKLDNQDEIGNSAPCVGCQRAIAHYGIQEVVHS